MVQWFSLHFHIKPEFGIKEFMVGDYFQIWATVDNTAINILGDIFWCPTFIVFIFRVKLKGHSCPYLHTRQFFMQHSKSGKINLNLSIFSLYYACQNVFQSGCTNLNIIKSHDNSYFFISLTSFGIIILISSYFFLLLISYPSLLFCFSVCLSLCTLDINSNM